MAPTDTPPEPDKPAEQPEPPKGDAEDAQDDKPKGTPAIITDLKSVEQQVGEHVVQAMQFEGASAVLTMVQPGPAGTQRLVSVPLNDEMLSMIQEELNDSQVAAAPKVPCMGFHCPRD